MGFTLVAQGLLRAYLLPGPWHPLVYSWGYPVGFLIVILGRQQLFTENTITAMLPLLGQPTLANLVRVLELWGAVLAANLAGTLAFAWVVANRRVFTAPIGDAFALLGYEALRAGFGVVLLQGVFAGWLIALMVWLLPLAEGSRVSVTLIITYLVGLGKLAHVIAGSVEVLFLATSGLIPYSQYLGGFLAASATSSGASPWWPRSTTPSRILAAGGVSPPQL